MASLFDIFPPTAQVVVSSRTFFVALAHATAASRIIVVASSCLVLVLPLYVCDSSSMLLNHPLLETNHYL